MIAVSEAILERITLRICVPVNIIQLTSQVTNVEICALTFGFIPAHDEAVTVVFDNFCKYHVTFKTTVRHIVRGSTLLGRGDHEERPCQKQDRLHF